MADGYLNSQWSGRASHMHDWTEMLVMPHHIYMYICGHTSLILHVGVLLFIAYKFVKGFLAIIILAETFMMCVMLFFLYNKKRIFSLIRQKTKSVPIDPIIKIAHFCNVMSIVTKVGDFYNGGIDMTLQKWAISIMGVYGEISHFCPIQLKFCCWLYKKRWHTSWKFQFEKTRNKKVIAKNPLITCMNWTVDQLFRQCTCIYG